MPYSYLFGDVVVSAEELNEKISLGALAAYEQALRSDPTATLEFSGGVVSPAAMLAGADPLPFEPIGIGKPLSVEILGYYTGDLPPTFGFKKPGMLVSSAVKAIEDYDAQAKAVNQIVSEVDNRRYLRPSAEAEGSPIVQYAAALVPDTITVDLTLAIDRFDEELFGFLASLLKAAAGLPVFFVAGPGGAAASTALLAGSVAAKKAGELGKVLFNSKTFLRDQIELRFDTPGFSAIQPGAIFACDLKDRTQFEGFKPKLVDGGTPQQHMIMQNDAGQAYGGPAPYIILNLDGRRRDNLADFKARAATSAILEKFVGSPDAGSQAIGILQEAMGLFNDSTFREKALVTQRELSVVDERIRLLTQDKQSAEYEDTPAYKAQIEIKKSLESRLEAYNNNIHQEIFKLL